MSQAAASSAGRSAVVFYYVAGAAQGLALVTFPAASAIFADPQQFGLSGAQYGAMFIPQVVLAICASALGPWLARRLGLRGVLALGLGADAVSMALLASSAALHGSPFVYAWLCAATGALGLGFGATTTALNALVEGAAGDRADAAALTLNATLGLGTALAPLFVLLCNGLGVWWVLPLGAGALLAALFAALLTGMAPQSGPAPAASAASGNAVSRGFWLFAAAALLYGIVETLCGNWATLYLQSERGAPAETASLALTAFWVMVTLGRLLFAALGRWLPGKWLYPALPLALAIVFQGAAHADGAVAGVAAFAVAGLACSALLPLSMSLAIAAFPSRAATISGELIAFYQIGYGVAAFGVGPLHDDRHVAYAALFSAGSVVAVVLAAAAWGAVRRRSR